jgi:magnesium-protoporphyrin O-methyltransferase
MLAALETQGIEGRTLVDVGSGIGVLAHELLQRGAASATVVDAASAYLEGARREAEARGTAARMAFRHGDLVDLVDELPPADLVTLDRVVCCYPDGERLLRASAACCTKALALSFPRERWYVRLVFAAENLLRTLRGDAFRTFVHPEDAIRSTLRAAGLRPVSSAMTVVWRVELYARETRG